MSWWTNPNLHPKTKSKFVVVFGGTFYLPNVKSLNKPKVEFDTKEYRLLNHKFNYPGNATWQPITIKFVDMNGMGRQTEQFDTGAFLWQIMNNTGYTYPHVNNSQFRDPHFRNVDNEGDEEGGGHHIATKISFRDDPATTDIDEFDTWKTITTPEKSSTIANSFGLGLSGVADFKNAATSKQKISIYQLAPLTGNEDMQANRYLGNFTPKGAIITECWHLINPIVKTIGWGDLDYSADDLVEYELGVVYDWAVMDRTQIGEKFAVSELPYQEFMKTLFVDNPEAFLDEEELINDPPSKPQQASEENKLESPSETAGEAVTNPLTTAPVQEEVAEPVQSSPLDQAGTPVETRHDGERILEEQRISELEAQLTKKRSQAENLRKMSDEKAEEYRDDYGALGGAIAEATYNTLDFFDKRVVYSVHGMDSLAKKRDKEAAEIEKELKKLKNK